MKSVFITFNSMDDIKTFCGIVSNYSSENSFRLKSGRFIVDPTSIMGIFSLDISKPVELIIENDQHLDEILNALKPYLQE
ncbi:MAG: HPr family phosphocarrier protein [Lachnospiraceae bacterium]|nr:HPr family phosphocarrier protein [Lachnospiraceae bacterium]